MPRPHCLTRRCKPAYCGVRNIVGVRLLRRRIEPGKQQQAGEKAADMRLPGDHLVVADAGHRQRAEPEQNIDAEPHRRRRRARADRAARREAGSPARDSRCRRRCARKLSGPPRWNAKRIAAAMVPEIAAEAPITGTCSPACVARCNAAPAAAVTAKNARNRTAPNRRATALPNGSSHTALTPRCVQSAWMQRIGDEGPQLRAEAARQARRRARSTCRSAPG